jgi:hypothetical protein
MADDKKPTAPPQKPIIKRDKKEKPDARIDSIDKGVGNVNKNLDSLIAKQGQVSNRAEQRADLLIQAADTQRKIDELAESGRSEDAAAMQKSLEETSKLLKGSKNDAAIGNRLAELAIINKDTSDLIEKHGSKDEQATKENLSGIRGVIQKLEEQKTALEDDTLNKDLGRQLGSLGGVFGQYANEETKELKKAYDDANVNLKDAIANGDDEAAAAAREQIEEIKKGAESEESRREAQKINLEANSRLTQIAEGMESFGSSLDSAVMSGAKTAGFVAGLTGLALMFLDPETFQAGITTAIAKISEIFEYVRAVISGDSDEAAYLFEKNIGLFRSIIGGIVLLFSGKIIKFLGTALKAARVFRIFMLGTFIPTLVGGLTAMGTAMGFAVGGIGVILAPVLLIVALIGGLYLGFKALQSSLGPGAGIIDTLKVAMLYFVDFLSMIVNGITFIPRKMISFLGKRAAKWLLGDDFDTSALDAIGAGLKTDRGATAAAEIKAKNEAQAEYNDKRDGGMSAEEIKLEKMANMSEADLMSQVEPSSTIAGEEILAMSDSNSARQKESATSVNAIIQNTTGGNVSRNSKVTSNVIQSPITKATSTLASVTSR